MHFPNVSDIGPGQTCGTIWHSKEYLCPPPSPARAESPIDFTPACGSLISSLPTYFSSGCDLPGPHLSSTCTTRFLLALPWLWTPVGAAWGLRCIGTTGDNLCPIEDGWSLWGKALLSFLFPRILVAQSPCGPQWWSNPRTHLWISLPSSQVFPSPGFPTPVSLDKSLDDLSKDTLPFQGNTG